MPRKSWSQGAKKAHQAMVDQYGKEQGEHIFYATANKLAGGGGKGTGSINAKASKAFKTGGTQTPKKKR